MVPGLVRVWRSRPRAEPNPQTWELDRLVIFTGLCSVLPQRSHGQAGAFADLSVCVHACAESRLPLFRLRGWPILNLATSGILGGKLGLNACKL